MAIRTIEAVAALLIVLGVVTVLTPQPTRESVWAARENVYHKLIALDQAGKLAQFVLQSDVGALKRALDLTHEYAVAICNSTDCRTNLPIGKDIVVVDYFIAGWHELKPRLLRIWLW